MEMHNYLLKPFLKRMFMDNDYGYAYLLIPIGLVCIDKELIQADERILSFDVAVNEGDQRYMDVVIYTRRSGLDTEIEFANLLKMFE
jgi:hypothetical protein